MSKCGCGCGLDLISKLHHKWKPAKYLPGHQMKGRKAHPNSVKALRLYRPKSWTEERRTNSQNRNYAEGREASNWRGGIHYRNGYRYIYCPEHPFADKHRSYPEHRLVIEKKIGRVLRREEKVHHLNLDKLDNSEDNLVLFANESQHQKFHYYLESRAIEILGRERILDIFKEFIEDKSLQ